MNQEGGGLTQRVEQLERENWWWKLLGVLGVIGFLGIIMMGQTPPEKGGRTIEVERFVLRGPRGETFAVLGMQSDPRLAVNASMGRP